MRITMSQRSPTEEIVVWFTFPMQILYSKISLGRTTLKYWYSFSRTKFWHCTCQNFNDFWVGGGLVSRGTVESEQCCWVKHAPLLWGRSYPCLFTVWHCIPLAHCIPGSVSSLYPFGHSLLVFGNCKLLPITAEVFGAYVTFLVLCRPHHLKF